MRSGSSNGSGKRRSSGRKSAKQKKSPYARAPTPSEAVAAQLGGATLEEGPDSSSAAPISSRTRSAKWRKAANAAAVGSRIVDQWREQPLEGGSKIVDQWRADAKPSSRGKKLLAQWR